MSRLLGLLGLGLRGGNLVVGVDGVRRAVRAGQCHLLIVASDASPRATEKVVRLAEARRVRMVAGPAAAEIGARLGRPPVMVVGVREAALARGLIDAAAEQA
jgi:ribosomal protein L7Ae-like RNA K-turn-binding protein